MITTQLQGRLGNQFYQIAMLMAYCKKYGLDYYIPNRACHCDGTKVYFPHLSTGPEIKGIKEIHEQSIHAVPKGDGTYHYNVPGYLEYPSMDNVKFIGYWQTFKYFDWCRDYILESFNLPYNELTNVVGIHCRYGDFKQLRDKHPEIPEEYYRKAIKYFTDLGYKHFFLCSDDIEEALKLIRGIDNSITITVGGKSEMDDFTWLYNCQHQILCYSTFGFIAAWLNQNPDKIVLIPESKYCFSGAHKDFIPENFKQIII